MGGGSERTSDFISMASRERRRGGGEKLLLEILVLQNEKKNKRPIGFKRYPPMGPEGCFDQNKRDIEGWQKKKENEPYFISIPFCGRANRRRRRGGKGGSTSSRRGGPEKGGEEKEIKHQSSTNYAERPGGGEKKREGWPSNHSSLLLHAEE